MRSGSPIISNTSSPGIPEKAISAVIRAGAAVKSETFFSSSASAMTPCSPEFFRTALHCLKL
jgi:hypothetical protein